MSITKETQDALAAKKRQSVNETRSEFAQSAATQKKNRRPAEESQSEFGMVARANHQLAARISELEKHLRTRDRLLADIKHQVEECQQNGLHVSDKALTEIATLEKDLGNVAQTHKQPSR